MTRDATSLVAPLSETPQQMREGIKQVTSPQIVRRPCVSKCVEDTIAITRGGDIIMTHGKQGNKMTVSTVSGGTYRVWVGEGMDGLSTVSHSPHLDIAMQFPRVNHVTLYHRMFKKKKTGFLSRGILMEYIADVLSGVVNISAQHPEAIKDKMVHIFQTVGPSKPFTEAKVPKEEIATSRLNSARDTEPVKSSSEQTQTPAPQPAAVSKELPVVVTETKDGPGYPFVEEVVTYRLKAVRNHAVGSHYLSFDPAGDGARLILSSIKAPDDYAMRGEPMTGADIDDLINALTSIRDAL